MALIGLVIAVMDRNMVDNREIEKRIEHNKPHMNYRLCLFTSVPCCLSMGHATLLKFFSQIV